MKLRFLCLALFFIFNAQAIQQFILHFDINKTIVAGDPASGKSIEATLIHSLGDRIKDCWDERVTTPISYVEYIEEYLLPGPKSDQQLKAKRNKLKSDFIPFLERTNHPLKETIKNQYAAMMQKIKTMRGIVFESFYSCIQYLEQKGIKFRIILRTFGHDLDRIKDEISERLSPSFFDTHGKFENGILYIYHDGCQECIESFTDFYQFLKGHSHVAIQDDYWYWNKHEERQEYGKTFPIDIENNEIVSIFFDDNIVPNANSAVNIINPRNAKTGAPLSVSHLIQSGNIVLVDTVDALLNDGYFIEKVEQAIA